MLVHFHVVGEKQREHDIADAVGHGVTSRGDRFVKLDAGKFEAPDPAVDVACVFALKGAAKRILTAYEMMGSRTLLFDKGLIRASTGIGGPGGYMRVSLDTFMPLVRIERMMKEGVSANRWVATGLRPRDRVISMVDSPVIYCGSSQKYCDYHDLGDEHEYAELICKKVRKATPKSHPVIYRPKPSYDLARPIEGTIFSRNHGTPSDHLVVGALGLLLPRAWALVTHGSHAAIDAIVAGVPSLVIGDGAAKPVSLEDFHSLSEFPPFPDRETRFRWLAAVAWWQWTTSEMYSGEMWDFLRSEMERPPA